MKYHLITFAEGTTIREQPYLHTAVVEGSVSDWLLKYQNCTKDDPIYTEVCILWAIEITQEERDRIGDTFD